MTPEDALNKQIELYRGMSGEQRLKIALDLHTFIAMFRVPGFGGVTPHATEDEVEQHLRPRIEMGRK